MGPLINLSHLDFAYGDQLVLKHIDLSIEAGSTLAIIGPNGGGKTTLLRLMLALHTPTRGSISIAGLTPYAAVARGNLLGYLPQNPTAPVNFPLDVRQTVRLGLIGKTGVLRGYDKGDLSYIESLLERLDVRDLAGTPIGELSGGQRQRVFIARALAPRPRILILDEPTTGIDRSGQQRFIELLSGLKREFDLTIIFTSHDLGVVGTMSDRIACLNVTLHYHDIPDRLGSEVLSRLFAGDAHLPLNAPIP